MCICMCVCLCIEHLNSAIYVCHKAGCSYLTYLSKCVLQQLESVCFAGSNAAACSCSRRLFLNKWRSLEYHLVPLIPLTTGLGPPLDNPSATMNKLVPCIWLLSDALQFTITISMMITSWYLSLRDDCSYLRHLDLSRMFQLRSRVLLCVLCRCWDFSTSSLSLATTRRTTFDPCWSHSSTCLTERATNRFRRTQTKEAWVYVFMSTH